MVSMFGAEGDLWKWKGGKKKNPELLWLIFHLRLIVQRSTGEAPGASLTLGQQQLLGRSPEERLSTSSGGLLLPGGFVF